MIDFSVGDVVEHEVWPSSSRSPTRGVVKWVQPPSAGRAHIVQVWWRGMRGVDMVRADELRLVEPKYLCTLQLEEPCQS